MIYHEGPTPWYAFESFGEGQAHAVFARQGGVSAPPFDSLNQSLVVGDAAECVAENLSRARAVLNCKMEQVVNCQQVHGRRVAVVRAQDAGRTFAATDGLVTATPGVVLTMRFADCVPVLLYSAEPLAVGIVHAGWRGTVQRVAAEAVRVMVAELGCAADGIVAGIGPAIGPCCFEVGVEVATEFERAFPDAEVAHLPGKGQRPHVDLWRANAVQLEQAGVRSVEISGLCPMCHQDRFFSHRGSGGHTGRFAAYIRLGEALRS